MYFVTIWFVEYEQRINIHLVKLHRLTQEITAAKYLLASDVFLRHQIQKHTFSDFPKTDVQLIVVDAPFKDGDELSILKDGSWGSRYHPLVDQSLPSVIMQYARLVSPQIIGLESQTTQTLLQLNEAYDYSLVDKSRQADCAIDIVNNCQSQIHSIIRENYFHFTLGLRNSLFLLCQSQLNLDLDQVNFS